MSNENLQVDVLIQGFPGRASVAGLSWATMALIRTQNLNIVVDTGSYPARRYLVDALKTHGLTPAMIDMVFLTHLHHDHVAGIALFPQALFVYSRKEWEYANMTSENAVQKASLSLLHAYRRRLIEKDGEEIIPGVTAMFTPGHSPGGVSYVLDMNGEKWILTGDAIKNRSELANREVDMTSNAAASLESIEKVRAAASRVLPGHDCWLQLKDNKVIPMQENTVSIKFPSGMTVNGQNPLVLKVD